MNIVASILIKYILFFLNIFGIRGICCVLYCLFNESYLSEDYSVSNMMAWDFCRFISI